MGQQSGSESEPQNKDEMEEVTNKTSMKKNFIIMSALVDKHIHI